MNPRDSRKSQNSNNRLKQSNDCLNFVPEMSQPKNIRILEVAEKLFAEKGFDGASIRDIAAEAGANVSMISYYFGSKENLMKAIIRQKIDETIKTLEEVAGDTTTTPVEKIEIFITRFVSYKLRAPQFSRILMTEQLFERNEEFSTLMIELRTSLANNLQGLLNTASRKGFIRKNIDVVVLVSTVMGTVNALMRHRDFYKSYHQISGKKEATFNADYDRLILQHTQTLVQSILLHEK